MTNPSKRPKLQTLKPRIATLDPMRELGIKTLQTKKPSYATGDQTTQTKQAEAEVGTPKDADPEPDAGA